MSHGCGILSHMSRPKKYDLVFEAVSTPPGQPEVRRAQTQNGWLVLISRRPRSGVLIPFDEWPDPAWAEKVNEQDYRRVPPPVDREPDPDELEEAEDLSDEELDLLARDAFPEAIWGSETSLEIDLEQVDEEGRLHDDLEDDPAWLEALEEEEEEGE